MALLSASEDVFNMDFRFPFSPFQAFAICWRAQLWVGVCSLVSDFSSAPSHYSFWFDILRILWKEVTALRRSQILRVYYMDQGTPQHGNTQSAISTADSTAVQPINTSEWHSPCSLGSSRKVSVRSTTSCAASETIARASGAKTTDVSMCFQNVCWWVVWNMAFMTFHILGRIIPTDELIFFRGVETTNQSIWSIIENSNRSSSRWYFSVLVCAEDTVVHVERVKTGTDQTVPLCHNCFLQERSWKLKSKFVHEFHWRSS
jgi:hypothetical protein